MHDPALRSRSPVLPSAPEDFPSAEWSSAPRGRGKQIGGGAVLSLTGLGIAAAATIVALFGTGYLLLREWPAEMARPGSNVAVVAKHSSESATGAAALLPSFLTGKDDSARAPDARRAAALSARANNTPAGAPGAPDKMATGPMRPVPTPGPPTDAVAPSPATPAPAESATPRPGDGGVTTAGRPAPGPPLAMAEINALLAQGDDAFRKGDLTAARLLYKRAYEANDGRGALGIGASYDPEFLRRYRISTAKADPEEARMWYVRARDLGAQDAQTRLKRLNLKPAR